MANAYSILHNYDQPVYQPNLDLVTKVLSHKQQKLDTGRQKLQSLYDEFSMLDIYKDSDREYAEERLNQVKSMVDKYASGDLSSDALVRDISSNMDNFVDDNVINAVVSTKSFKSDLSKWSQVQEDDPDRFGEQNYRYAMNRAQNYLANDKVGQKYNGEASFIEHVDLHKMFSEKAPEIAKNLGYEYVDLGQGRMGFRTLDTYEVVDRNQMNSILEGMLGDKEMKQMHINAWDQVQRIGDEGVREMFTRSKESQINSLNFKKESYQNVLDNNPGTEFAKGAAEAISNINEEINRVNNQDFGKLTESVGILGIATSLYKEDFKRSYLDGYSYAPRLVDSKAYDLDVKVNNNLIQQEKLSLARMAKADKLKDDIENPNYQSLTTQVTPTKRDFSTIAMEKLEEEGQAYNLVDRAFTNSVFDGDKALTDKFLAQLSLQDLTKSSVTKTINGKEYTINLKEQIDGQLRANNNLSILSDYLTVSEGYSQIQNTYNEKFEKGVSSTISNLKKAAIGQRDAEQEGVGLDYDLKNGLPDFGKKYVKNSKGRYELVDTTGEGDSYYDLLLKKGEGNLTESEQFTLEAYVGTHMASDPVLRKDEALSLEFNSYIKKKMSVAENVLPAVRDSYTKEIERANRAFEANVQAYEDIGVPSFLASTGAWIGSLFTDPTYPDKVARGLGMRKDLYLSDYTEGDINKVGGAEAFDSVMKNIKTGIEQDVENRDPRKVRRDRQLMIKRGTPQFEALEGVFIGEGVGQIQPKAPIIVEKITDDEGNFEGDYKVIANVGTQSNFASQEVTIKRDDVNSVFGGNFFNHQTQIIMDAAIPGAPSPELGSFSLPSKEDPNSHVVVNQIITPVAQKSLQIQERYGDQFAEAYKEEFNRFQTGRYNFKLEPYEGEYVMRIKDTQTGETLEGGTFSTGVSHFTRSTFNNLLTDANDYKQGFMEKYLNEVYINRIENEVLQQNRR